MLWTPGYWAWMGGQYLFHDGYWGPHIGFYGGIAYGFGYTGVGYDGGRWENGAFFYNRTVNNIGGTNITNVYNQTVVVNNQASRVSFNGGKDGTIARPTSEQKTYVREDHFAPTQLQQQHLQVASKDPTLFEKSNQGKPPIAATAKPADFKGTGITSAVPGNVGEKKPLSPAETKTPAVGALPNAATQGNKPALEGSRPETPIKPQASPQSERPPLNAASTKATLPTAAARPTKPPQGNKKEEKKRRSEKIGAK